MKMIMAIVSTQDEKNIINEMMKGGFTVTKLSSSGGFLKVGTTTLIASVNNERLKVALEIIRATSHGHKYDINELTSEAQQYVVSNYQAGEMVVGGATVFVLNIEETYKF